MGLGSPILQQATWTTSAAPILTTPTPTPPNADADPPPNTDADPNELTPTSGGP